MLRTLRLVAGAVAVLAAGAALAQPPKDGKEAAAPAGTDLFPLKAKSTWVYKGTDHEVTVVVSGTEKYNNEDCIKVDTLVSGQVKTSELYQVKADGVYRVKLKDEKIEPPLLILKLPAKKDLTWDIDSKVTGPTGPPQVVKGKYKIKDEKEKVKTPAGEFECVAVEGDNFDIAGTKTVVRQYFAPGKGLVKVGFVLQGAETTLELKEYKDGGK